MTTPSPIHTRPAELLQRLIQFDTTNPPGNEAECIQYIRGLLSDAGIDSTILAKDPKRPNLIARIKGAGIANPLLMYGHVDVVTTENQQWDHPPFEGKLVDGFIWGRGALDMKGGVAMMTAAVMPGAAGRLQVREGSGWSSPANRHKLTSSIFYSPNKSKQACSAGARQSH
jgi:acetylornithine deacetylase/succinyl-diaminopimelate desuccinylase-like protein